MLLVRLSRKHDKGTSFGRVLPSSPDVVEILDGDPVRDVNARPTGERVPYQPDAWQAEPDGDIALLPPLSPGKVIGVGSNYKNHAREMGKPVPSEPIIFMKPNTSVLAPGRAIERPSGYERVDYEGEIAVVIGKRCHRIAVEDAPAHVCGYTVLNDVSVRDLQKKDGQFTRAKGFDTFCPVGPAIATADAFDLSSFHMQTFVTRGGTRRLAQDSQGDEMVFSVYELIAFVSHTMTLEPGDVITTGTPAGVADIQPGDLIEVTIGGIGTLRNPVATGPAYLRLPPRPQSPAAT